ncbi:four helix bundle protein [Kordia periserrulae]|uniref:Four helix bundle protein n=1 Tax=Kordia periserrulae TaxID=701523 RepID=A0A2T6BWA1_9FLAO|nr:four helix bundle protein [Kordia periserrulae]PTX60364.1 four helix bundle protein [Kordia periserrulae]
MRNDTKNIIVELTFDFSIEIIKFSEELRKLQKYEMSSQIFRSGTSIGANIREAQNAESKADFIHKFKIAAKEADEVEYWLLLCEKSGFYPNPEKKLFSELEAIIKVISKIISSSKRR